MSIKKTSIALALIIFVFGCSSNQQTMEDRPVGFERIVNVADQFDTLAINHSLLESFGLVANEKYLFSITHKSNPVVKVFDNKTGEYHGGFGTIGGGPGEFERVSLSGFSRIGANVVASSLKKIRIYDVSLNNGNLVTSVIQEASIPGELFPFNFPFFLNDSTVAGKKDSSPKYFTSFSTSSGVISDYWEYPNWTPEIPETAYHHLYQSHTQMHPNGNKIVGAFSNFPILRIMEVGSGKSEDFRITPENEQKEIKVAANGRSIDSFALYKYFENLKVNENFILGQYVESEIVKGKAGDNQWVRSVLTEPCILIFNWEGQPILKLKTDEWMTRYTITPDNRVIFFHPEEKDELYVIDLDDLLK